MFLQCAVADAYGIGFEFVDDNRHPNDLKGYYQHPTYDDMIPGHFTDDTQRSIANALVILENTDGLFNPLVYCEAYQNIFVDDPRAGYSRRYEQFLRDNCEVDAREFALLLERKPTNGAVMGAAVLGYLKTPQEVMLAAACQAISTHSYTTIPYAQIIALSAHYFIHVGGLKENLREFLEHHLGSSSKDLRTFILFGESEGPITMGAKSVTALMINELPRNNSLSDLIRLAVDRGGDTDSAAAVLVAVASCSSEYKQDIPDALLDGLERSPWGAPYLLDLDEKLREHFVQRTEAETSLVEWKKDTVFLSSTNDISKHPQYAKFKSSYGYRMGYVIKRLRAGEKSINLFIALEDHYNVNPVQHQNRGYMSKMRRDWLNWLDSEGIIL